jgi:hypothetical protein
MKIFFVERRLDQRFGANKFLVLYQAAGFIHC